MPPRYSTIAVPKPVHIMLRQFADAGGYSMAQAITQLLGREIEAGRFAPKVGAGQIETNGNGEIVAHLPGGMSIVAPATQAGRLARALSAEYKAGSGEIVAAVQSDLKRHLPLSKSR